MVTQPGWGQVRTETPWWHPCAGRGLPAQLARGACMRHQHPARLPLRRHHCALGLAAPQLCQRVRRSQGFCAQQRCSRAT